MDLFFCAIFFDLLTDVHITIISLFSWYMTSWTTIFLTTKLVSCFFFHSPCKLALCHHGLVFLCYFLWFTDWCTYYNYLSFLLIHDLLNNIIFLTTKVVSCFSFHSPCKLALCHHGFVILCYFLWFTDWCTYYNYLSFLLIHDLLDNIIFSTTKEVSCFSFHSPCKLALRQHGLVFLCYFLWFTDWCT